MRLDVMTPSIFVGGCQRLRVTSCIQFEGMKKMQQVPLLFYEVDKIIFPFTTTKTIYFDCFFFSSRA
jgi:hypothetical protein